MSGHGKRVPAVTFLERSDAMRRGSLLGAALAVLVLVPLAGGQPPGAKPGPEFDVLKELVGTWDATIKLGDQESKGTMVYKMDLGGMWLSSRFEGDFGGMKLEGKGMDGYNPAKKKYVGVWFDSMSPSPMISEGTYDKDKGIMTMIGEGPGPDGKPTKYKQVLEAKDKDTMVFNMYTVDNDGKEQPMMSIHYKRKK
jgi:hypothetical protein